MRVVALLFLFFALWALDGLNSYWNYVTGRVLLYMPSQLLRLATGMLNGLGLSALVYPMFNFTMWRQPSRQRVIRNWRELAGILGLLAAQIALLLAGIGPLLYPFALLNMIGVLVMLTLVNGIIAVLLLRRENRAQDGRQAVLPLGLGFLLSIAEVGVMAMLRHLLAPALFPSLL
jgi:hypothetical protein